ncbi:MAG: helix-turn-helix domain-containing protein [Magnetococcales bacterium]|nr:helix-turn-helix domain-containing protein [Magnetococcales bacterium]
MKDKGETFLTTRQAAELLEVNSRTVQNWVERGVLRAWKTAGGHRRISREAVEFFLQQRKMAPAVPPVASQREGERSFKVLTVANEAALWAAYENYFGMQELPVQILLALNGEKGLLCMVDGR